MNKKLKRTMIFAACIGAQAAINYSIFKLAEKREKSFEKHDLFYNWRYGKIHYQVFGEGEPLLLIHGIGSGSSLTEWTRSIRHLSKRFKVYAIDLIGFGHSDKPKISYSSYMFVSLMNDFIQHIIGEPVNVIASSTSASFVVKAYDFCADNFKKMLLISPTNISSRSKAKRSMKAIMELPIIGTTLYNIISSKICCEYFLKQECFSDSRLVTKNLIDKYNYSSHVGGVGSKYVIASFLGQMLDVNLLDSIKNIDIPIYIIWGEKNKFNSPRLMKKILKANPQIFSTVFESCKLLPHVENVKLFHEICDMFL